MPCGQSCRPADADRNSERKKAHEPSKKDPAYANPKKLVCEEHPPQGADGMRSCSSHCTQMPSQICRKQNAQRAKHLVTKNDLRIRNAGVTDWEWHGCHCPCSLPESQDAEGVPRGSYK